MRAIERMRRIVDAPWLAVEPLRPLLRQKLWVGKALGWQIHSVWFHVPSDTTASLCPPIGKQDEPTAIC